jgi:hypothetical protein
LAHASSLKVGKDYAIYINHDYEVPNALVGQATALPSGAVSYGFHMTNMKLQNEITQMIQDGRLYFAPIRDGKGDIIAFSLERKQP